MSISKLRFAELDEMNADALAGVDVAELRALFVVYRTLATHCMGRAEFERQLKLAAPATPALHIVSVRKMSIKCDNCRGTGRYSWGACINGVMQHSGPCYRCEGKGKQTFGDMRRNRGYDYHGRRLV